MSSRRRDVHAHFRRYRIDAENAPVAACASCSAPPTPAQGGRSHPDEGKAYLEFQVSDCVQCNLCADACLKKCIEIVPVVSMEELFDFEPRLVEISAAKKGNKLFNRNK